MFYLETTGAQITCDLIILQYVQTDLHIMHRIQMADECFL
jgi:hypothetical protein